MKLLRRAFGVILLITVAGVGSFHFRVTYLMERTVPAYPDAQHIKQNKQNYFAYGTNMSRRYLYNARGVLPMSSEPGSIQNYEIAFLSPGLNSLEPAFAYLVRAEAKVAYGVLHHLTDADMEKIKESEGQLYKWATLTVKLDNGQIVSAQTLVRVAGGKAGRPSRRYLQILVEGAKEHGLPSEYVVKLSELPSVYVPVASELMGDVMVATVMNRSGKCKSVIVC